MKTGKQDSYMGYGSFILFLVLILLVFGMGFFGFGYGGYGADK